ncbi:MULTISPECIES: hypothetical protein [Pseudofrankia]|uniref:hypothetical protein n=1 Tax=Pseudofrankia TaxID=2994363 RepID=UPI0010424E2D|nr:MULTISPECIES: hypothetical protein [Pseudofrankia]
MVVVLPNLQVTLTRWFPVPVLQIDVPYPVEPLVPIRAVQFCGIACAGAARVNETMASMMNPNMTTAIFLNSRNLPRLRRGRLNTQDDDAKIQEMNISDY